MTATPTDTATYPNLSGTASIPVTPVTYSVFIQDAGGNPVPATTPVDIFTETSATFTVAATSTPPGARPTNRWTWLSTDPSVASVSAGANGVDVIVSIPYGVADGATATITAINSDDSSLKATFTVRAKVRTPADVNVGETVKLDGVEYIVLVKGAHVVGKADGETTAAVHESALLLRKYVYTDDSGVYKFQFGSDHQWANSTIRSDLNGTYLTANPTVAAKALEVELYTRGLGSDATIANRQATNDKVFLLSEADMFGTSNASNDTSPQLWEYTYNGAKIPYFTNASSRLAYVYDGGTPYLWWLRSPCGKTARVACVSDDGGIPQDTNVGSTRGLRPAFWYNMDP